MNHVMLDLETLGTSSNAALLAIGAIEFDPDAGTLGREFYQVIDPDSCVRYGLTLDVSTILWWMHQDDDVRQAVTRLGAHLATALNEFAAWYPGQAALWGNGSDFDNVILASAYRAAGIHRPWRYSANRCYRTLKAVRPDIELERTGTHHHALDDARTQARHAIRILQAMKGTA